MPFSGKFRDYQAGDFIFGLKKSTDPFEEKYVDKGEKSNALKRKQHNVRGLSLDRDNVNAKFEEVRKSQNLSYLDALEKHLKYHRALTPSPYSNKVEENKVFRAKSKGGLLFCIQQGTYIHFLLDNVRLAEVVGKSGKNEYKNESNPSDKLRGYTGSELRWLYRNRHDPNVQELVQFWLDDAPCSPPWSPEFRGKVSDAPDWSTYKA